MTLAAPILFIAGLGALLASFIAVISERAYTGQSWRRGRSRCNSCKGDLAARDLIPVFSWVASRGRCRLCGSRVPVTYVVIEASLAALFALGYAALGPTLALALFLAALSVLAFIVLYDLRHTIVPPVASGLLAALCFLFALVQAPGPRGFGLTLLAAGAAALFLFLLFAFSRGRAMGLGDAPIAFALALLVGPDDAFAGLLFSFWTGALFGIGLLLARRGGPTMGIEVPFVPFLALGFLLAYFIPWNPAQLFLP